MQNLLQNREAKQLVELSTARQVSRGRKPLVALARAKPSKLSHKAMLQQQNHYQIKNAIHAKSNKPQMRNHFQKHIIRELRNPILTEQLPLQVKY